MPAKQHYIALDGLRGIAALVVISDHVFEGFATSPATQTLNHGYLAVDFFFILSGFVMAYAYDSRWTRMTTGNFFLRRLIRLHPMVIAGSILGVATFLLRGNGELFPLNGPTWSLFFEYIGNILYAILLRRVSNAVLIAITCTLGIVLSYICIANGQLGVGWTAADGGIWGGLIRMSFSDSLGMLIARTFRPKEMRIPFWVSAAALTLFCIMPYAGINGNPVWNGLYDAFCVVVVFPIILVLTAGSPKEKSLTSHTCKFIGDLSYPLYAIHYPFMYLFFAFVWNNQLSFAQAWPYALVTVIGSILLATFLHYFYEKPLRKHLTSKLKD